MIECSKHVYVIIGLIPDSNDVPRKQKGLITAGHSQLSQLFSTSLT